MTNETISQPLPTAPEAERLVLGAILSSIEGAGACFDFLRPEDFFVDVNRHLFTAAQSLRERGEVPDLLGVHEHLARDQKLQDAGGIAYIASLSDGLPRIAPVGAWAKRIRDKARMRTFIKTAETWRDRAFNQAEDAAQLLDGAIEALSTLAREIEADTDDGTSYHEAAVRLMDELCDETKCPKIFTGIDHLDRITGGFRAGELITVTAETGTGKTLLSQQTRQRACADGRHSLFASGEMLAPHLLRRSLAAEAGVSPGLMRRRDRLSEGDFSALVEAASHQCKFCRILDGELDLARIRRAARRMKARTGLELVVIDYDELVSAPGETEFEQQSNLARAAKGMAMELGCVVILVSQLRKPLAGEDAKRPTLARLYGSSTKVKFASVVLLVDRPYVRELEGHETGAQVFVLKNRDGRVGRIPCRFDVRRLRFESVEPQNADERWDSKARAANDL
jgi:replicative DNA helicase